MGIIVTAEGKDLKTRYSGTFPTAADALEKVAFLEPIAARIEIRDDSGEELSVYGLRLRVQMEQDDA